MIGWNWICDGTTFDTIYYFCDMMWPFWDALLVDVSGHPNSCSEQSWFAFFVTLYAVRPACLQSSTANRHILPTSFLLGPPTTRLTKATWNASVKSDGVICSCRMSQPVGALPQAQQSILEPKATRWLVGTIGRREEWPGLCSYLFLFRCLCSALHNSALCHGILQVL